jgi:hypothetical protein
MLGRGGKGDGGSLLCGIDIVHACFDVFRSIGNKMGEFIGFCVGEVT